MKSTFRFSTLVAVCVAALLLRPGFARAADDDLAPRRTQAEALLHAMHTDQVLAHATTNVDEMVDKFVQTASTQNPLSAEQKTAVQKAQTDAHTLIHQQLSWDAVKADFIQAYAEAFTEDDLKGLVAFYSSPLGQKLVEKQPAVTEKMGKLTQQKFTAVMPTAMGKIRDAAKPAAAAAPPAPAAIAPAPGAPLAPAPATPPKP